MNLKCQPLAMAGGFSGTMSQRFIFPHRSAQEDSPCAGVARGVFRLLVSRLSMVAAKEKRREASPGRAWARRFRRNDGPPGFFVIVHSERQDKL